jgi:NAD(P)-dependent dehydrogenase (short-subunit alcohol dehydrogenase family)
MRTVVVTGGTRGIGRAISCRLAQEKYNVVMNYVSDEAAAKDAFEECKMAGGNVLLVKGDVSSYADVKRMFFECTQAFGAIDAVVNNAGLNIDRPLLEMTEEEWDRVVDINMKGVFLVSKTAAWLMKEKGVMGHIINIAASTGIGGRKNGVNYCASKAGVIVMTKCLAKELGPSIRVNCIIPGITRTEEIDNRFDLKKNERAEVVRRQIPLDRIGEPSDVANLVHFLLSSEAAYINGQKIIIDGGEYMY